MLRNKKRDDHSFNKAHAAITSRISLKLSLDIIKAPRNSNEIFFFMLEVKMKTHFSNKKFTFNHGGSASHSAVVEFCMGKQNIQLVL